MYKLDIGDSLTANGYGSIVGASLGLVTYNKGYGGTTASTNPTPRGTDYRKADGQIYQQATNLQWFTHKNADWMVCADFGVVDSMGWNSNKDHFVKDYVQLLKTFRGGYAPYEIKSVKFYIGTCSPTRPHSLTGELEVDRNIVEYKVIPKIKEVVAQMKADGEDCTLIDTFNLLDNSAYLGEDGVHLNTLGVQKKAEAWISLMNGTQPPIPTGSHRENTDWTYWNAHEDGVNFVILAQFWIFLEDQMTVAAWKALGGAPQQVIYFNWKNGTTPAPNPNFDKQIVLTALAIAKDQIAIAENELTKS